MKIVSVGRIVCRSAFALTVATGLPFVAQLAQSAQPAQQAASAPVVPEYKLKAAFVYNFVLFTDWPMANAGESAPLNVCVSADSALRPALNEFNDKTVRGRRMQIRPWTDAEATRQCQVLVLDSADREHWMQIRKTLVGAAVLTVADDADIGRNGAVITLYLENNRIAFDIDMNAARQARLVLSSKLLRLARTTP